jgi:glycosyltransferase involved in cell wall biosynthesis
MNSGIVTVVDPTSDIRGIARAGEHLAVYPSVEELPTFLRELAADRDRLDHIATRGPDIVRHLHTPDLRAEQLLDAIWPRAKDLDGRNRSPTVSVLTCCYKFLKRFRVYLDSIARQELPPGTIEIVVADPGSPDGLADYLPEFAERNPHLRVVHLPLNPIYFRNRGVCINRAFDASSGSIIAATDGDIVFPQGLIGRLAEVSNARPDAVIGVRRIFVTREATGEILEGRRDPMLEFATLAQSSGDGEPEGREGVLGYCQVVGRQAFAKARYPEEFDMVNQSDIVFVERLQTYADVSPVFLQDEAVLHLWHSRDWAGSKEYL